MEWKIINNLENIFVSEEIKLMMLQFEMPSMIGWLFSVSCHMHCGYEEEEFIYPLKSFLEIIHAHVKSFGNFFKN